jgi:hypothetical protein
MKTGYDRLVTWAGYHDCNDVWLSWPTHTKGKSPKLQPPWEDAYRVVTQINDVVYRIQWNPRLRMMVVHLDWLAPYQGTAWGKRPSGGSSRNSWRVITVRTEPQGRKARLIADVISLVLGEEEMVVCL